MTDAIRSLDGRSVAWEPFEKQAIALSCPADEVMYGGTKGPGKSDALIMRVAPVVELAHRKYIETGIKQTEIRIYNFRKTLIECEGLIGRSKTLYPLLDPEMGPQGWKSQGNYWEFTSGMKVYFRHLEGPDDYRSYNGVQMVGLGFDQVEEIPRNQVTFIQGNVRNTDLDYARECYVFMTANPGGRYAEWVYDEFVRPNPDGMEILEERVPIKNGTEYKTVTKCFVPGKLSDNPYYYNSGDYEARLRKMTPLEQKWYIDGDWTAAASGYFKELLNPNLHFIQSFDAPPTKEIEVGIDWGEINHPSCAIFGFFDNDGRLYVIDEIYEPGITGTIWARKMAAHVAAAKWHEARRWRPAEIRGYIDPSASFARSQRKGGGDNVSIPAAISAEGFNIWPANNERVGGWREIAERLALGKDGYPQIYIFRDRCPNLIRELTKIQADAKKPGDVDTTQSDHALDALRYLCNAHPITHLNADRERQREEDDLWLRLREAVTPTDEMSTGYGD